MAVELKFNQAALAQITQSSELARFVHELGGAVVNRANALAEKQLQDEGGGGVGSLTHTVEHDEHGVYDKIFYPDQFFYMWYHELGTEHERPRPHVRRALYGTKQATGGKTSAITGIKQDKQAAAQTKASRQKHRRK